MPRWARISVLLLLLTLFMGCADTGRRYAVHHTVEHGDTLFSIAWRYNQDYRDIAVWNHIRPPYTIYPGQELTVAPPYGYEARQGHAVPQPVAKAPASAPAVSHHSVKPASRPPASTVEKAPPRPQTGTIRWQWPTRGQLVNRFDPTKSKKGVDIGGKLGQSIRAAAGGEVAYSGNGLRGYGNLIIIKHNDTYLSAYAFNRRLLVKEGERVKKGQKIAEMGKGTNDGSVLHFEIRRDGKPVDPLRYLPK